MALSAFDDKAHLPETSALEAALGPSARMWKRLIADVAGAHAPIDEVWNFAGPRWGWSLRLKQKDRIVLYLTPQVEHFQVGVVLGERAAKAAHQPGMPAAVLDLIDGARAYAEGRGIRLTVRDSGDVDVVLKLAALKMAR